MYTSTHIFKKTQANNSSNNYNLSHDLREMETVIGWVESPAKWGSVNLPTAQERGLAIYGVLPAASE